MTDIYRKFGRRKDDADIELLTNNFVKYYNNTIGDFKLFSDMVCRGDILLDNETNYLNYVNLNRAWKTYSQKRNEWLYEQSKRSCGTMYQPDVDNALELNIEDLVSRVSRRLEQSTSWFDDWLKYYKQMYGVPWNGTDGVIDNVNVLYEEYRKVRLKQMFEYEKASKEDSG